MIPILARLTPGLEKMINGMPTVTSVRPTNTNPEPQAGEPRKPGTRSVDHGEHDGSCEPDDQP